MNVDHDTFRTWEVDKDDPQPPEGYKVAEVFTTNPMQYTVVWAVPRRYQFDSQYRCWEDTESGLAGEQLQTKECTCDVISNSPMFASYHTKGCPRYEAV